MGEANKCGQSVDHAFLAHGPADTRVDVPRVANTLFALSTGFDQVSVAIPACTYTERLHVVGTGWLNLNIF
jgi:hypothetical protein